MILYSAKSSSKSFNMCLTNKGLCGCKLRRMYFSLTSHLSHITLCSEDNSLQSIISFGNLIAKRGVNVQGTFNLFSISLIMLKEFCLLDASRPPLINIPVNMTNLPRTSATHLVNHRYDKM